MKTLKALTISIFLLTAFHAQGSIAFRGKNFSPKASQGDNSYTGVEVDLNRKFIKSGRDGINTKDIAKIIPFHIGATGNGDRVKEEILKKTASSVLKSSFIQNSFLGKTVKKAQKATTVGMSIKTKPSTIDAIADKKTIEHKFGFNVEALKKEAKITYKGYVDSKVLYNHNDSSLNISIEEKLSKNSNIALVHRSNSLDSRQMINFRMNW